VTGADDLNFGDRTSPAQGGGASTSGTQGGAGSTSAMQGGGGATSAMQGGGGATSAMQGGGGSTSAMQGGGGTTSQGGSGGAPGKPNGAMCSTGPECASGLCVDGVCCDGACTGVCLACNVSGKEGTCAPVPGGTDPAGECNDADCVAGGNCDGGGQCACGEADWAHRYGADNDDRADAVVATKAGTVIVAGRYEGSSPSQSFMGCTQLGNSLGRDMVLIEVTPPGTCKTLRRFPGPTSNDDVAAYAVAVDTKDNVLVAGFIESGTVSFDTKNATTNGRWDGVFLKLDAGTKQAAWAHRIGGPGSGGGAPFEAANGIAADASDNVFVTGHVNGPMTSVTTSIPGATVPPSLGADDAFLLKLKPDASAAEWVRRFGSATSDSGNAVAVDQKTGAVVVAGEINGATDFGGGLKPTFGLDDAFVAKYDAAGAHQWSQALGGAATDRAHGVAIDPSTDEVVVVGEFRLNAVFGNVPLVSAGNGDVFVAKLSGATGLVLWAQRFGGAGTDIARAVSVGSGGNIVVTGEFTSTTISFGAQLSRLGGTDAFLAKLSPDGTALWAVRYGANSNSNCEAVGRGVAFDASAGILAAGSFGGDGSSCSGPFDFGAGASLTNNGSGSSDLFFLRRKP
jgi:hypothetical protein